LALGAIGLAAAALACGDSGSDDDGDDDTTTASSMTMTMTMTGPETSAGPTGDPTTDPTTGTATTPTTETTLEPESSSSADESSSTGTPGDTVTLQNDGFTPEMKLFWQTWPMPDDCWASTYEIDESLYPFDIVGVMIAIGGSPDTATFEFGIWSVDGDGFPDAPIGGTAMVDIEGDVQNPDLDVEALLDVPTIDSGSFAVVFCHVDHMGAPSIGIDQDGTVDGAHNFIRDDNNDWVPSPDFFNTDGDFILRAIVRPV
jgi:hypothetical protein